MDFVDFVVLVQIAVGACLFWSAMWAGRKAFSDEVESIDGDSVFAALIGYYLVGGFAGVCGS